MTNFGTMIMYKNKYAKQAKKDAIIAKQNGFKERIDEIVDVLRRDPYEDTPGHYFEALSGDLKGAYSRRINYNNRIVYTVQPNTENLIDPKTQIPFEGIVIVHRAWGHEYTAIDKKYRKGR